MPAPLLTPSPGAGDAPLCLPSLRRPIGWRELDDATLVARAHSLLGARFLPPFRDVGEVMQLMEPLVGADPRAQGRANASTALMPSDAPYRDALARMQAQSSSSQDPANSGSRSATSTAGVRFPGWLLTGALALALLQMLMLVVAIKPLDVVDWVRRSVQEWQTSSAQQRTASSDQEGEAVTQGGMLDPAHWWQSRQQATQPLPPAVTSQSGQRP